MRGPGKTAPLFGITPIHKHGANQDGVLENERHIGSARKSRNRAKLFMKWPAPPHDTRVAFQAAEVSTDALHVDSPGFRIDHGRRPADALWRDLGQVDIEPVVPDDVAGGGVRA